MNTDQKLLKIKREALQELLFDLEESQRTQLLIELRSTEEQLKEFHAADVLDEPANILDVLKTNRQPLGVGVQLYNRHLVINFPYGDVGRQDRFEKALDECYVMIKHNPYDPK